MFTSINIVYIDEITEANVSGVINVNLKNIDTWYLEGGVVIIETGGKAWETTLSEKEFIDLCNENLTVTYN